MHPDQGEGQLVARDAEQAGDHLHQRHRRIACADDVDLGVAADGVLDQARRVGQVEQDGVRGAPLDLTAGLEHDRQPAARVVETARPDGFLARQAEGAREGLVEQAPFEPANAHLVDDEGRTFDRLAEVLGEAHADVGTRVAGDQIVGDAGDQIEPFGVAAEQDGVVGRGGLGLGHAFEQERRRQRAAAQDGQLDPIAHGLPPA